MSQYGLKRQNVKQFMLQQTGTYNDQFRRPYTSNMDSRTFGQIVDTVSNIKGNINASNIASFSNGFIIPMATPEGTAGIVNGWDMQRLRFIMSIETEDYAGTIITEHIVGYTDHYGVSYGGAIDPNMVFHINAITILRTVMRQTTTGMLPINNVVDCSHILRDETYQGTLNKNNQYGLRPEDIYSKMSEAGLDMEDGLLQNLTHTIGPSAKKSSRDNNIGSAYTAKLLNGYIQSSRSMSDYGNQADILTAAKGAVESASVQQDAFLTHLSHRHQMNDVNFFTADDLLSFDSNALNVMKIIPLDATYNQNIHSKGQTSNWSGSDYTTQFAVMLSQAIPSYMLQFTINKVVFMSTNMDMGSQINTKIVDLKSFNNHVDMSGNISAFLFKIENDLLKGLSHCGQTAYTFEMSCNLLGETWISLSLNGAAPIEFVCPSFADSLLVPVVTYNESICSSIANDVDSLVSQISDIRPAGSLMSEYKTNLI